MNPLQAHLVRSFNLTHDLIAHLDEASLRLDLPGLPSNRIADQLWCMVGARESYLKAIQSGGWQGFSCSLSEPRSKPAVVAALDATLRQLEDLDFSQFDEAQANLAFDLLEHELQHHGQLIRFVYGNGLTFPESWHTRYTV